MKWIRDKNENKLEHEKIKNPTGSPKNKKKSFLNKR